MPEHSDTDPGGACARRARLCLDFANTVDWHASAHPSETLRGYPDLLQWAARHGVIDADDAGALARRARREPRATAAVYRRALALREAIYRIFVARATGAAPARADVQVLNDELQRALPRYRIEVDPRGAAWTLAAADAELDLPLAPIVQSAAALLLAADLRDRVGQCADPGGCGWLFLDLSKNRSRRWCSIRDCGNRAKQRRLQARLRQARRNGGR